MASGITSGRRRRPLVPILAALALLVAVPTGPATAALGGGGGGGARPTPVRATQMIVALLRPHEARAAPTARAAPVGLVPAATPITDERTTLPLLARHGRWLKVRLPGRPNGHTGWIVRNATVRFVTDWHIVVDPRRRQVTVYRAGRPVRVFRAVVGKPSTPTPPGTFFVEESIALRPTDVGAPFALALSARSNVLQEFDGGPGQIALHGLANIGGVPGTAVSHGCIRLDTTAIRWLVTRIGPGVPVTIAG